MPRQFTPEEIKIIRRTEKEGAELAQKEHEDGKEMKKATVRRITGLIVLAVIFILFACIAYFVVSATAK